MAARDQLNDLDNLLADLDSKTSQGRVKQTDSTRARKSSDVAALDDIIASLQSDELTKKAEEEERAKQKREADRLAKERTERMSRRTTTTTATTKTAPRTVASTSAAGAPKSRDSSGTSEALAIFAETAELPQESAPPAASATRNVSNPSGRVNSSGVTRAPVAKHEGMENELDVDSLAAELADLDVPAEGSIARPEQPKRSNTIARKQKEQGVSHSGMGSAPISSVATMQEINALDSLIADLGSVSSRRLSATSSFEGKQGKARARRTSNNWSDISIEGEWKGESAGGCINYPHTVCNNPQFLLSVLRTGGPTTVNIQLTQDVDIGFEHQIGIVVADKGGKRIKGLFETEIFASTGVYSQSPSVQVSVSLDARDVPYTVLVSTFNPGEEASFSVKVMADGPVKFVEAPPDDATKGLTHTQSVMGAWQGETAGGCVNFETHKFNPMYVLSFNNTAKLHIRLTQLAAPDNFHAVGCLVVDNGGVRVEGLFADQEAASTGPLTNMELVETVVTLPPTQEGYTLLPSTFSAGEEGAFELTVSSDVPITLTELPPYVDPASSLTHEVSVSGSWEGSKCGGCFNHDSARANPTFHVTVSADTNAVLTLTQDASASGGEMFMIGMFVGDSYEAMITGKSLASSGQYVDRESVRTVCELKSRDTPYLVFVSTFNPGEHTLFTLSLKTAVPATLTLVE